MAEFIPDNAKTSVDFIAWSVAKMERDKTPISPSAVAGNMYLEMAEQFYNRLNYYRLIMEEKTSDKPLTSVREK
jgi:hypothetical protein